MIVTSYSGPYETSEISFENAVISMDSAWSNIIRNENINPSLSLGWLKCACDAFRISDDIKVFVIYKNSEVASVIPYYFVEKNISGITAKCIELATNLVTYHQELITQLTIKETMEIFISHLRKKTSWDAILFKDLQIGGKTYEGLTSSLLSTTYLSESSPYLALSGTWEQLIASKPKKFRYKVNKREKELANNHSLKSIWFRGGDNYDDLINDILHIEQRSWKVQDSMDITSRPIETLYYKHLIPYLSKHNLLIANVLKFEGIAIAYNLCYQVNGYVGQIKTSFDNSYQELSPGAMIIEEALRQYYQEGYIEFDFLGDVMPHKMAWTKKLRPHETVIVYNPHSKGYLIYIVSKLRKAVKNSLLTVSSKIRTKQTI